jgi:hypothetical protein
MPDKERGRYQTWRDCLEIHRPKTSALPLGRLKAPTAGWLIVTGRRGHYSFCDATGAYDLATGAAFVHESCSGLRLIEGGDVDRALTDAARRDTSRWGRLSVDNLREALWMMLLQEHAVRIQIAPEFYPLPNALTPETVARGDTFDSSIYDAVSASTAQTTLAWRWVPPTGPEITGEITWPSSFDAAEDHATALLTVAELGLVPGCVPRRAPSVSVLGLPEMRVNPVDAPPDTSFYRKAEAAYKQWQRAPVCRLSVR